MGKLILAWLTCWEGDLREIRGAVIVGLGEGTATCGVGRGMSEFREGKGS